MLSLSFCIEAGRLPCMSGNPVEIEAPAGPVGLAGPVRPTALVALQGSAKPIHFSITD